SAARRRTSSLLPHGLRIRARQMCILVETYTPAEQRADAILHAVGLSAGLVAVPAMLVVAMASLPIPATLSLVIYGATLLAMLGSSAAYHLLRARTWKDALQRLDHATIFLKIAGTYTPF